MNYSKLKYFSKHTLLFTLLFFTVDSLSQIEGNLSYKQDSDTCFIPFEKIETDCICIPFNSYMIIDSDSLLATIIMKDHTIYDCEDYYPDNIDFKNEILIGFCARSAGCTRPEIKISIYKIDSLKKLECKVNVIRRGNCLAMLYKIIWIKFDKPKSDFTINVLNVNNKLTKRESCIE